MSSAEKAERRRQAEFERTHTVTDFSEIWRLKAQATEPEPEVERDYTLGLLRHRTERVETTSTVTVRIGRHEWPETRTVVVYRTRRQCGSRFPVGDDGVRCVELLDELGSHPGMHRAPGFAW